MAIAFLLWVMLGLIFPLWGAGGSFQFQARLLRMADGDTVIVTPDHPLTGATETIRLADIDCPEKDQPYGKESRAFTQNFLSGKLLQIKVRGRETYCRVLAEIYVGESNLGEALVGAGLAWVWPGTSNANLTLLESNARLMRIGLWKDPDPTPPWEWRKRKRSTTAG